jgi:hypothetical protein
MVDMLSEFWQDYYEDNPLASSTKADGTVQFEDTGDPLIDKWETELANGKIPDYLEGFDDVQRQRLNHLRKHGKTRHGHLVKPPATLKGAADTVTEQALDQGLDDPTNKPFYPLRFKDQ